MTYVPDPDDATNPIDSVIAETATAEFKALKLKINTMLGLYNAGSPELNALALTNGTTAVTQAVGTNNATIATMAAIFNALAAGSIATLPGFISGFKLSNDAGTPATKVDVAVGTCIDHTNTTLINLTVPKIVDFTINGAGGLDTGAVTSGNWYAVIVISGTSGQSVMATKEVAGSSIAPTMPAGYTVYRYIGSVYYVGTALLPFVQFGQYFYFATAQGGSAIHTNTLTVFGTMAILIPLGISVRPNIAAYTISSSPSGGSFCEFFSGITANTTNTIACQSAVANIANGVNFDSLVSDTSGNIKVLGGVEANNQVVVNILGWIDPYVALSN